MAETVKTPVAEAVLGEYRGLRAVRRVIPVLERDVDDALLTRRRRAAVWEDFSGPAARRDRVTVSAEAFFSDGAPVPESGLYHHSLILGSGTLMKGAERAIEGHRAGEEFPLPFTYPEDFRVEALQGCPVEFHIVLEKVERQVLPTADDTFARAEGYDDLAALRRALWEEKRAISEANADRAVAEELLRQVAAGLQVRWKPGFLEAQAARDVAQLQDVLRRSGETLESFCVRSHTTPEALRQNMLHQAEGRALRPLAARCLAEAEGFVPTAEEVEAKLARLASEGHRPAALTAEAESDAMILRRALAWLPQHAEVTTVLAPREGATERSARGEAAPDAPTDGEGPETE